MATLLTIPMASLALQTRSSQRSISYSRSEALCGTPLSIASLSVPLSAFTPEQIPLVYCGRGDKKTAKGKRFKHSFGNARPRNKNKGRGPPRIPVPPSPPKKDPSKDEQTIEIEVGESDNS